MSRYKNIAISGQYNLFDYMANMDALALNCKTDKKMAKPTSFAEKKAQILLSAEQYLQKGEQLATLAKERYGEMVKLLSFTEIEEKLFNINVNSHDLATLVPKIATTVIRPLLKALTTFDEDDAALRAIRSLVDYDICISKVDLEGPQGNMDFCYAVSSLKRKSSKILKLVLREKGYRDLIVYGLWLNAHVKSQKSLLYKDRSHMGDIAEILAYLVCFTQFNRAMTNDDLKPGIENALLKKTLPSNYTEGMIKRAIASATCHYPDRWYVEYEDLRSLYENKKAPISIPLQKIRKPSEAAIETICSMLGVSTDEVVRDTTCSYDVMQDRNRLSINEKGVPERYVITNEIDLLLFSIDPINWARNTKSKLVYNMFLQPCDRIETYVQKNDADYQPIFWAIPSWGPGYSKGDMYWTISCVLELIFKNYKEKVETLEYLRETKSRAKVYQTKKNIPDKVIKMMQESVFNKYFGYVELDESCDLGKVSLIADQFIAFKETYLNKISTQKVQIRFRKLGNYKAAGLYFPHIGCLCVDIRNPDSFIHEYGHCIDNILGSNGKNLSNGEDFYQCFIKYKSAFSTEVYKSKSAKDILKGKYDEKYYLQKTEAFARCFEMYVMRTLRMQNSICKPDSKIDFAYPHDETLMNEINKYFSALFAKNHEAEDIAA